MSNAPPTPPPTTDAEIRDEERSNALASVTTTTTSSTEQPQATQDNSSSNAAVAPAPPPQPSQQDSYQLIFPSISQLAAQGKWRELILTAEIADVRGDNTRQTGRMLVTAPLVLAYLIEDELNAANHALMRLPKSARYGPLPTALTDLLRATRARKHAEVYSRSESLFNSTSQAKPEDTALAGIVAGMVPVFVESFRRRTFVLLSQAYSSLSASLAQTYIGLSPEALLAAAEAHGWLYDATTQNFTPKLSASAYAPKAPSTLGTFEFVSSSVATLEA